MCSRRSGTLQILLWCRWDRGTAKLDLLRPVSFTLKSDTTGTRQYGLIAEEVAKVYPELRDSGSKRGGPTEYAMTQLAPMLLNEVQQLKQELAEMHATLDKLQSKNAPAGQR